MIRVQELFDRLEAGLKDGSIDPTWEVLVEQEVEFGSHRFSEEIEVEFMRYGKDWDHPRLILS